MLLYFQNQSSEFLCTKSVSQNLISAVDAGHLWAIRTSLGTSKSHIFSQLLAGKVVPEWSKCSLSMANVTLSKFTLVLKKVARTHFWNIFWKSCSCYILEPHSAVIKRFSMGLSKNYEQIWDHFLAQNDQLFSQNKAEMITFCHKMINFLTKIRLKWSPFGTKWLICWPNWSNLVVKIEFLCGKLEERRCSCDRKHISKSALHIWHLFHFWA